MTRVITYLEKGQSPHTIRTRMNAVIRGKPLGLTSPGSGLNGESL